MLFRMLGICFIGDLLTQTMLTCDTVLPDLAVTSPFEMPQMAGRLFCVQALLESVYHLQHTSVMFVAICC